MRNLHSRSARAGFKTLEQVLHALNHVTRRNIVEFIDDNERVNVKQVQLYLGRTQAETSQQLAVLRKCDLVLSHKQGKKVFYTLNKAIIAAIIAASAVFSQAADDHLMSDEGAQENS